MLDSSPPEQPATGASSQHAVIAMRTVFAKVPLPSLAVYERAASGIPKPARIAFERDSLTRQNRQFVTFLNKRSLSIALGRFEDRNARDRSK